MKNLILIVLLVMMSFSAGVSADIQIIKPKTPITNVKTFHNKWSIEDDIQKHILSLARQGYITKSVSISEYSDWQRAVVVMEKY